MLTAPWRKLSAASAGIIPIPAARKLAAGSADPRELLTFRTRRGYRALSVSYTDGLLFASPESSDYVVPFAISSHTNSSTSMCPSFGNRTTPWRAVSRVAGSARPPKSKGPLTRALCLQGGDLNPRPGYEPALKPCRLMSSGGAQSSYLRDMSRRQRSRKRGPRSCKGGI